MRILVLFFLTILFSSQAILAQTSKPNYEVDTFLNVNVYKLSYENLRKSIANNRFGKQPGNGWYQPKNNSQKFPSITKASLRINQDGLQHLILEFKPENFTPKEFAALRTKVAKNILKFFPCKFTTTKRFDGSSLSRGISRKGLHIHMEYFCPKSVNYQYLSYLKVKVSNKSEKISPELHDISLKDEHLRAFANYIEATAYTPLTANEMAQVTARVSLLKRKNHLHPKPSRTFYTDIIENNPYYLEFADHGYPSIKKIIGLKEPNKNSYHRWTWLYRDGTK